MSGKTCKYCGNEVEPLNGNACTGCRKKFKRKGVELKDGIK